MSIAEIPEVVFQAQPRGDVLRIAHSVHPFGGRLDRIVDAEAAVAESARLLENATREYRQQVERLNLLRSRQGLPNLPESDFLLFRQVGAELDFIGRVTERLPLTAKHSTTGTFRTTAGEEIRWTASAPYVDALEALFGGVPVEIKAALMSDGTYTLNQIKAAPRPFWESPEDYDRYAGYGPLTVMSISLVKKELRQKHGKCQQCRNQLPKRAHCSLIDTVTGPQIVCRPCKQDWIDAGRPEILKAVA